MSDGSKTIRQTDTPKIIEVDKPIVGRVGAKRSSSKSKKVVNCQEADILANTFCGSQYRSELYEKIKACNMMEVFKRKLRICGLKGLNYSDAAKVLSSQLHVKLSGKELQKMLGFYPDIGMCFSFSKEEFVMQAFEQAQNKVQTTDDALKILDKTGDAGLGLFGSSYSGNVDDEEIELTETESTIHDIKKELSCLALESEVIEPDEELGGEEDE